MQLEALRDAQQGTTTTSILFSIILNHHQDHHLLQSFSSDGINSLPSTLVPVRCEESTVHLLSIP